MKPFQFSVVDENTRQPLSEFTPVVTADTVTEAMNDKVIVDWCKARNARIFKVVLGK